MLANERSATDFTARALRLWGEQRFEEVEALARAGLQLFPADEELRTYLAHSLLTRGRYREAFARMNTGRRG